ncbi:MAG: HAMP domain-containing histidine kinase [Hyphomicrobiales bacterium]|nr:MAG: HAMP domain-containing histidine kinase [Hyphomicrobiales bacterium]
MLLKNHPLSGKQGFLAIPRSPAAGVANLDLAAIERAIVIVSRELKQPLSALHANINLLRRLPDSAAPSRIQGLAEALQRAIEGQTRIIDDLLDLSRVRNDNLALSREAVDFGALALELVAAFSTRWPPGRIHVEMRATEPLFCDADSNRLAQIVNNLLDNATKFSPCGGTVLVRISSEDGFARLVIADSGRGISRELLPHVFSPFSRGATGASVARSGLGVGLAQVHRLAVAHGGFVKATSDGLDRGAEFSVWLPLCERT